MLSPEQPHDAAPPTHSDERDSDVLLVHGVSLDYLAKVATEAARNAHREHMDAGRLKPPDDLKDEVSLAAEVVPMDLRK